MSEAKKKHGSQTRQRMTRVTLPCKPEERADIESRAERAGLSVAGYLRALAFGKDTPQPRAARRPPVEKAELVAMRYELRKIGGNLNQIAHSVNAGQGFDPAAYAKLCAEHSAALATILAMLNKYPAPMIIKGGSHSGRGLGDYLLQDKNDRAEVWEIRGDIPRDLGETLDDWRSDVKGSKTTKPLYHAQLNPDRALTREEWDKAITLFEKEMGFEHQPRAIVFHEHKGREHIHLVYCRLGEDGKALSDSWNYLHHEKAARVIENELGLEKTQGTLYRAKDQPRPERTPSRDAIQQGERTKQDPKAVKAEITALYRSAGGDAAAFAASLKEQGYRLAKGDQRGLVVVDAVGGVHSLTRASGAKAGELREMFKGYDLLSVAEAKAIPPPPRQEEATPFYFGSRQHSINDDTLLKRHKWQIIQGGAVEQRGLVGKWHEQQAEWLVEHKLDIADPLRRYIKQHEYEQDMGIDI